MPIAGPSSHAAQFLTTVLSLTSAQKRCDAPGLLANRNLGSMIVRFRLACHSAAMLTPSNGIAGDSFVADRPARHIAMFGIVQFW